MRTKLITAGVGLFGYGVLIGWAVTGDIYDSKMKRNQALLSEIVARRTAEAEAAKSALLENYSDRDVRTSEILFTDIQGGPAEPENETVYEDSDVVAIADDVQDFPEGETAEDTRARLQSMIDEYTDETDTKAVQDFTEMAVKVVAPGARNTPPFVISRVKYSWDEEEGDDYAKLTHTYYPQDRVLLDDDDEVVENKDIDSMIGWKNLDRFGDESDDPNVVYIRNRRLETDFEVIRDTENRPPAHVRFGMGRHEYEAGRASGQIRFRTGDV